MVKIRLRRMGTKARPFYRIVVAKSTAARDGAFVEVIGTCNPLTRPKQITLKSDRALHWLMNGAQPTETVAFLLKQEGVLDKYFEARPAMKSKFKSLDKRTAATSKRSVMEPTSAKAAPAEVVAPVEAAAPQVEAVAEEPIPADEAIVPVEAQAEEEPMVEEVPVVDEPVAHEEAEVAAEGAAELAEAEAPAAEGESEEKAPE